MKTNIPMTIIKIVVIVLLVAVLMTSVICNLCDKTLYYGLADASEGAVYDTYYYKPQSKKAMILIPGLMASTLYDLDTNEPLWGYTYYANLVKEITKVLNLSEAEKIAFVEKVVSRLKSDENNIPLTKTRVGTMADAYDQYGTFQGMGYIYDILQPLYGKQYDVVVWQYDWRQSNVSSGAELEKFIDANGWDEVMFFTHSMGGCVVSNYLARSVQNRDMTKLFMPFGCPFFGSMDAINNLFVNPNSSGLMDTAVKMIKSNFGKDVTLFDIARTLPSVYELLPSLAYDQCPYFDSASEDYVGVDYPAYIDGKPYDCEGFNEQMKNFSFTKKANGESMPIIEWMKTYYDNLYVEKDGKKVFVSDTVNTEYIVGIEVQTMASAQVSGDGILLGNNKTNLGDGTVPAYSASAGHKLTDNNVHLVYGIGHGPLANNLFPDTKDKTGLRYVEGIMKKYIAKTDKELGL